MENYDFETYLEIDSEIEKLRHIAKTFGKRVSTDSMRPHQLSVFIDLDNYFRGTSKAENGKPKQTDLDSKVNVIT